MLNPDGTDIGMFGISSLSIIPVRKEATDKAEIVTQLLFGEVYKVLLATDDKKWLQIECFNDGYQGLIDTKQHHAVEKSYVDEYQSVRHPLSKDIISFAGKKSIQFPIVMGSILPFFNNGIVDLGFTHFNYSGNLLIPSQELAYKDLEKFALLYVNSPYLWGGRSHFGIDCSGFVQMLYKFAGVCLPRDAWQQAELGAMVNIDDTCAGDVAFFNNPQGRIIHVGLLLSDLNIIHASGEVRVDKLDERGIFNEITGIYSHKLAFIKRFHKFS